MKKPSWKSKGFTTKEVQNLTGVSARKLRWWDKQDLVKPSHSPERKHSQTRLYTLQDIICVLVVRNLREKGLSLQRIKKSVERIQATGIVNPLAKLRVACLAQTVIFRTERDYIEPISGQEVIKNVLDEIRPHLKDLRALTSTINSVKIANQHYKKKVIAF
ncbi:unnamed protein product [marine sediment metagenome]|uniref:HTH merR-type domain-containing protein n=1 Tax=marine sediment metagenome TaxID=412755 RepID=X0TA04_9ZZZZ